MVAVVTRPRAQYSYILQSGDLAALREWYPKVVAAFHSLPELTAIDAREGRGAAQVTLIVDRDQAKRLGIDMAMVTTVLNNAYSQRQISTIYDSLNQYQVVMEVNPIYAKDPITLNQVQVITSTGARIPLSTIAHYENSLADDTVRHEGQFASQNIAFDMARRGHGGAGHGRHRTCDRQARVAGGRHRQDGRHRRCLRGDPEGPAVHDPRRTGGGVPGAGRAVRELYPSADDPFDLAVGRGRGVAVDLRCWVASSA